MDPASCQPLFPCAREPIPWVLWVVWRLQGGKSKWASNKREENGQNGEGTWNLWKANSENAGCDHAFVIVHGRNCMSLKAEPKL